jgi:hypothetical protein
VRKSRLRTKYNSVAALQRTWIAISSNSYCLADLERHEILAQLKRAPSHLSIPQKSTPGSRPA